MDRKILVPAAVVLILLGLTAVPQTGGEVTLPEGTTVDVEIASTPNERTEGLMFREELPENEGMLFVYDREADRSFWMKNTLIPLDIIFIDSEGKVINIEAADPEPDVPDSELERYRSERPAKYVLEVNQGFSERNNMEEGDELEIEYSTRSLSLGRSLR